VSRSSVSCNKINIADYLYPGCADSSELELNDVALPTSLLDALTPDVALPSRILQTEIAPRDILRRDSRVPKPIAEPPPGPGIPSKIFLGKLYTPHQSSPRLDFIESFLPNKQISPVIRSGEYQIIQINYRLQIFKQNSYKCFSPNIKIYSDTRLVFADNCPNNKSSNTYPSSPPAVI
jgi:hypothetical protein